MNPTTNPTTPPDPQAGATPDLGTQCPICHGGPLRFSYDSYGTHAYCDSGCHGEILLPCYIEEAKALIRKQAAALATSRAETEAARAERDAADKMRGEALYALGEMQNQRDAAERHIAKEGRISDSEMMALLRRVNKEFEDECIALRAQLATLTATLAQREAEVAKLKEGLADYDAAVRDSITRLEAKAIIAARDTALARVRELEAESERLKRGDFTPEEFQNLCHNRHEKPGCTAEDFFAGCAAFQRQLFGRAKGDPLPTAHQWSQSPGDVPCIGFMPECLNCGCQGDSAAAARPCPAARAAGTGEEGQ